MSEVKVHEHLPQECNHRLLHLCLWPELFGQVHASKELPLSCPCLFEVLQCFWQQFRTGCQGPQCISSLNTQLATSKSIAGWVNIQLPHWPELLWRKLEERTYPSFPLGTVFYKLWLYCWPPLMLSRRWAAAISVLHLGPLLVWPWPVAEGSTSWLGLGPAVSLMPCQGIAELWLTQITLSLILTQTCCSCTWTPCRWGHSLFRSVTLCSWLTLPCETGDSCCSLPFFSLGCFYEYCCYPLSK